MLNKCIIAFIFLIPLLAMADISEDGKYASSLVQINLSKYQKKSEICHQSMKKFSLSDIDKIKMQSLPREAGFALGKLLDDALNQCAQPEIFNLANSLLLLQEQNLLEKSGAINNQIEVIRKLVFSKTSLSTKAEYDKLSPKIKYDLAEIDFLKKPFDLFVVIEGVWGIPN